ncbi:MAG: DUF4364 family protein [Christensenellales bacterium]|jgi:hypothetical protein
MDKQTREFTENKLVLLDLLDQTGVPLTNLQISRFAWEYGLMNYFDMQECLYELAQQMMIDYFKKPYGSFYEITPLGKETLSMFSKGIRQSSRKIIQTYAEQNRDRLREETHLLSDYEKIAEDRYVVRCRAIEQEYEIFTLSLDVSTSAQAETACNNWQSGAAELYRHAMETLLKP